VKGGISLLAIAFLAAALLPAASASFAQTTDPTRPLWLRTIGNSGGDETGGDETGGDETGGDETATEAEPETGAEASSRPSPGTSETDASKMNASKMNASKAAASKTGASEESLQVAFFNGPAKAYVGEPVTYRALLERKGVDRRLSYRWQFGDSRSPTGLKDSGPDTDVASSLKMISTHLGGRSKVASTHTYKEPGVYPVTFYATSGASETGPGEEGRRTAKSRATVTVTERGSDSPEEGRATPVASAEDNQESGTRRKPTGAGSQRETAVRPGVTARSQAATRPERAESSGRWGVVVASLRSARKADAAADQYRRQLEAEPVSVEVMSADMEEGRRFRVVVGMFESGEAARNAIATHRDKLPVRAWTVRLQDRFLSENGT